MSEGKGAAIVAGLSNDEYHSGAGISKSGLDVIRRSPAHFKAAQDAREAGEERKESKAFRVGSAEHGILLEYDQFCREFALPFDPTEFPEAIDGRDGLVALLDELNAERQGKLSTTGSKDELVERILDADPSLYDRDLLEAMKGADLKAAITDMNTRRLPKLSTSGSVADLEKRLRDAGVDFTTTGYLRGLHEQDNADKSILSPAEWRDVRGMRDGCIDHPILAGLLTDPRGQAELSVYWTDEKTGTLCRCRPDLWVGDVILDIKTTEDARADAFERSSMKWRYYVQAPWYCDGIEQAIDQGAELPEGCERPRYFVFGVVEKGSPHLAAAYVLDAEAMMEGRREYRDDLDTFAACVSADSWPGYGEAIQRISLPEWRLRQLEQGKAA